MSSSRRDFIKTASVLAAGTVFPLENLSKAKIEVSDTDNVGPGISGADSEEYFIGATSTRPATNWNEAFLSGNGRMGAMMFGEPYNETIVLNHCKLYLPVGSREIVHDLAGSMPRFRTTGLKAGMNGPAVVHKAMLEETGQQIIGTDPFHPACLLKLDMIERSTNPVKYIMTEDFKTGELAVRWSDEQGEWGRRMFVSRTDNVVVMAMTGPKGKVSCNLSLDIEHKLVKPEIKTDGEYISAHVVYTEGKGGYDCIIRVISDGGKTGYKESQSFISGADRILLIMQVQTWRTSLSKEKSEAWAFSPEHPDFGPGNKTNLLTDIKNNIAKLTADYNSLLKPHSKVHGELFSRVKLDLSGGTGRNTTSEVLLRRAAEEDHMPSALMERIYDACRYLTICSTGERPPNLQGIWTGTWTPDWSGDYTLDSNIQLEIQSLMSCGMPELMESYFRLVESWLPDCRVNAKKFYGCRGIMSNARASNVCLLLHWGTWPGEQLISCMGWMAHFFYDYYLFTGDREFLQKRAVPLLRETALFYEDLLEGTEDDNGKYRFYISYSPEHELIANATFDISVAKAVLTYLIKSYEELSIVNEDVRKWKVMLGKMPPYLINEGGGLQEWSWPGAGEDYNHRHHSHLLPLYQFCEFDREISPALWKASEVAFDHKVKDWLRRTKDSNSNHITHGMMNQGQCAARLGRNDVVYEVLSRIATRQYLYPSFMIAYWPGPKGFGFDPVGTIPDIVNNSLVFAWAGILDLIPALPEEWPKGSINGVLARGQIKIIKLEWDRPAGHIDLTLTSGVAQTITVRLPPASRITSVKIIGGNLTMKELPGRPNCRELVLPAKRINRIEVAFRD